MTNNKPRVIAFYLPQYHPTSDNDIWWGKGFTEWTNVGKAKALFKGHYQPKVPADLGYYDLRLPEVREAQAELAREAGIEGFCYYHYWFGEGKRELELPFNEVLRLGKPDFPFCLCWANESWHSKFWNMDGTIQKKCLIEQKYDDVEGQIAHFKALLPAFKDKRYIRIDGKPLFMIYMPFEFPKVDEFIALWNRLAQENGLNGIYFMGQIKLDLNENSVRSLRKLGFDAINTVGLVYALSNKVSIKKRIENKIKSILWGIPRFRYYQDIYHDFLSEIDCLDEVYPSLVPNWDHTPRSGKAGNVVLDSTPENFRKHIKEVFNVVRTKPYNRKIVFLKSWNEWGEGNYMEPDLKYGKGYLEVLREELDAESV